MTLLNQENHRKQVAEQDAITEKHKLAQAKLKADQEIEAARAEAQALKLKKAEVTRELIQLKFMEKWDGKLPEVLAGENGLLLNIPTK